MLTIRMQRTGRKGYASFRIVVQDSKFSPSSGRVVAKIGHYNPHTKEAVIDKDQAAEYLKNGAQPSPRVVKLFQAEKIKLPEWVEIPSTDAKRKTRNPEKLRKNQPKEEAVAEAPAESDEELAEEIAEVLVEEEIIEEVEAIKEVVEAESEKIVEEAEVEATETEKTTEA
jgi:small subunit ribosomal protein S16